MAELPADAAEQLKELIRLGVPDPLGNLQLGTVDETPGGPQSHSSQMEVLDDQGPAAS